MTLAGPITTAIIACCAGCMVSPAEHTDDESSQRDTQEINDAGAPTAPPQRSRRGSSPPKRFTSSLREAPAKTRVSCIIDTGASYADVSQEPPGDSATSNP